MNILSVPYFAGGLSHFLPLLVLNQKHIKPLINCNNYFLVNNNTQNFLKVKNIKYVPLDFDEIDADNFIKNSSLIAKTVLNNEILALKLIKPDLIIEDSSFTTQYIAQRNNIPRISIQRTGVFRSINKSLRNTSHLHSLQNVSNLEKTIFYNNIENQYTTAINDFESYLLKQYANSKVKIIPGIASIELLPENIKNKESYFYSGPLLIKDRPSKNLSIRLKKFLNNNKRKRIIFITTGTIDRTPIEKYIEYFAGRNYAVITTSNCDTNEIYKKAIFYNRLLPMNYICEIADLVIHQCGSGIYHYPLINRLPSLTIGTKCYDREDVALRLQELGVSEHIPHPDDNQNYWNIFENAVNKFENNELTNYVMLDKLKNEIDETISNFKIQDVINYALS